MRALVLLSIVCATSLSAESTLASHSKGVACGKAGDHLRAQKLLQNAVVASPHDAELLYDAGVAEFKCGNHTNAAHYFEKAAESAEAVCQLQEEALFNAGNARAHLKEYDTALQHYQKVLAKNPEHERARHNYEVAKKLKEQEENQQKDDAGKDDADDKQQDDSGNDEKSNSENNGQQDNNKQNGDDQESQDKDGSQSQQESDSGKDQKNKNKNKSQDQQSSQEEKQNNQGANKQDENSPAHQDESTEQQDDRYNNTNDDRRDAHQNPSGQKEQTQAQSKASAQNTQSAAAQPAAAQQQEIPDELAGPDKQWMRGALEACDKQDTKHNKQLLRAVVGTSDKKGDPRAVRSSW